MARTHFTGLRPDGSYRTICIEQNTLAKIETAQTEGATIIITSSRNFVGRKYARKIRLCLTNDHRSGWCKHAVWACWEKGD